MSASAAWSDNERDWALRDEGDGRQPYGVATHPAQRRTHHDGLAAYGGVADRLRLCDRAVLRALAENAGREPRFSATCAEISGPRADRLRGPVAADFALAV